MNKNQESFSKASTIIALSIILGTVTYAWTGPTQTAPNGNVPAPINTGNINQMKTGGLGLGINILPGEMLRVFGDATFTNKAYSSPTVDSDAASSLVTKGWVEAKLNALKKVDCVGSFVDTSVCSVTCGGGVKQQTYTITTPAQNGGNGCPYSAGQTQWGGTSCNTQSCTWSCVCNGDQPPMTMPSNVTGQGCSAYSTCGNCGYGGGVHWSSCIKQ